MLEHAKQSGRGFGKHETPRRLSTKQFVLLWGVWPNALTYLPSNAVGEFENPCGVRQRVQKCQGLLAIVLDQRWHGDVVTLLRSVADSQQGEGGERRPVLLANVITPSASVLRPTSCERRARRMPVVGPSVIQWLCIRWSAVGGSTAVDHHLPR